MRSGRVLLFYRLRSAHVRCRKSTLWPARTGQSLHSILHLLHPFKDNSLVFDRRFVLPRSRCSFSPTSMAFHLFLNALLFLLGQTIARAALSRKQAQRSESKLDDVPEIREATVHGTLVARAIIARAPYRWLGFKSLPRLP